MHLYKLMIILSGIAVGILFRANAQELDSLLDKRQQQLDAYGEFRNTMQDRTWLNLLELNKKAAVIIESDNALILDYLRKEYIIGKELRDENEKLRIEMAYMNREARSWSDQLDEYRFLNNLFIFVILGLSVGLVITAVIMAGQFRRNKNATLELERLWSMNDGYSASLKDKEKELHKQVHLLEIENKTMQKELSLLSDQKSAARRKLEEEIKSRQRAEKEIQDLIGQMKRGRN